MRTKGVQGVRNHKTRGYQVLSLSPLGFRPHGVGYQRCRKSNYRRPRLAGDQSGAGILNAAVKVVAQGANVERHSVPTVKASPCIPLRPPASMPTSRSRFHQFSRTEEESNTAERRRDPARASTGMGRPGRCLSRRPSDQQLKLRGEGPGKQKDYPWYSLRGDVTAGAAELLRAKAYISLSRLILSPAFPL